MIANRAPAKKERVVRVPDAVKVPFFDNEGTAQGERTFTPGAVSNYPNIALLKEAVRRQQGRLRRGTASTRTRSQVRGSTHKPWRQKGTGRARSGTRSSPLWRGGGITFGPKPRSYDYRLPRKQRRIAVRHALLSKLLDGETLIIERLELEQPSTCHVGEIINKIGAKGGCLIGVPSDADRGQVCHLVLSCRNLHRVEVLPVCDFNALSLLKNKFLLLTEGAFNEVQEAERGMERKAGGES